LISSRASLSAHGFIRYSNTPARMASTGFGFTAVRLVPEGIRACTSIQLRNTTAAASLVDRPTAALTIIAHR